MPISITAQQAYKVTYQREFTLEGIKQLPIPASEGGYEGMDRTLERSVLYHLGDRSITRSEHPVVEVSVKDGKIHRDSVWENFVVKDLVNRRSVIKRFSGYCHYGELSGPEDWNITNEVKSINGMLAQRAEKINGVGIGNTVWFYPASLIHDGPGSTTGLPGLVVDLVAGSAVHFYLLSIEKISKLEFEYAFKNTNDCDIILTQEEYINAVMGN